MLSTEYSKRNLAHQIRPLDNIKYKGVLSKDHYEKNYIRQIYESIESGSFAFAKFKRKRVNGFDTLQPTKLGDELVLRLLAEKIRRTYSLKQSDRNTAVRQVKLLIQEATYKTVDKFDIKSFYESICLESLVSNLIADRRLSQRSCDLLEQFVRRTRFHLAFGLPRGIGLSATLAELAMQDFDARVRRLDSVYYYVRYVDDLIVVGNGESSKSWQQVKDLLPERMKLNGRKSKAYTVGCQCQIKCRHTAIKCPCRPSCTCTPAPKDHTFDFLGYHLEFEAALPKKKPVDGLAVELNLSKKKLCRIKTRIVKSFLSNHHNKDFPLLVERLRFLSENHVVPGKNGRLKSGIHYNASLANRNTSLEDLNQFLRAQIFSRKGRHGAKINASLSPQQRRVLAALSFVSGFNSFRTRKITPYQFYRIQKCWK